MRHWVNILGRRDVCDGDWSVSVPYLVQEIVENDCYGVRNMTLNPGDVVVDVGANVGLFTMYAALKWPGVKVVAVEPMPSTFGMLWTNVCHHGLQDRVTLINRAVAPLPGKVQLAMSMAGSACGSAFTRQTADREAHWRFEAETISLDQIFEQHVPGRCALLKMDCEGAEHATLMSTRVLDRVDRLRAELHDNATIAAAGHSAERTAAHCRSLVADCELITCNLLE